MSGRVFILCDENREIAGEYVVEQKYPLPVKTGILEKKIGFVRSFFVFSSSQSPFLTPPVQY
jgi:hypothetical protein